MRKILWIPRIRILKGERATLLLARWITYGFDYLGCQDFALYQFGNTKNKTINFIYKPRKIARGPTFLYSIHWRTKGEVGGFRYGKTARPINTYQIWSQLCRQDLDLKMNTTTGTATEQCGNGLIAHVQE